MAAILRDLDIIYNPIDVSKLSAPCYHPAPMDQQPLSSLDIDSSEMHTTGFWPKLMTP